MSQELGFAAQIHTGLTGYGTAPFLEFERRWHSGDEVCALIYQIESALARAGVTEREPVGIVVRNRVAHAAAILGFVATGRPAVMIYGHQSPEGIAADVRSLGLAAVLADHEDWTEAVASAVRHNGTAGIVVSARAPQVELRSPRSASAVVQQLRPGLHILSSGTTGPPKRVPLRTAVLEHLVLSMTHGARASADDPPDIVFLPFGSVGVCQLLAAPYLGKRVVLLEKFTVADWVRAVKTHRVRRAGASPAIVRMLLDSDVSRDDLASLQWVVGGAGPLEQGLRDEFLRRFGVPVLWAYGATEFAGSVCAWTPELYERFGASKPDTAGRPLPGVRVRVVDPDDGSEVAAGVAGLLEARVDVMGHDWIRTTDVASVDADGFVTILGRGDGAINRGGFKILPETVRAVLLRHPAVRDACVVGVPDRRLGEVPFAAVETKHGQSVDDAQLLTLVRAALPSHHVPVAVAVVDALPRNAAMKVRPGDVAALYAGAR